MIRQAPGTISLGQGVVSYGPPREALEAVRIFPRDEDLHKYQAVYGVPELLEAIKTKLRTDNGIDVGSESRIVVTAGGNMAFVNAVLAIGDPDDEIILQEPYYFNHEMAIAMANCRAVMAPTDSNSQLRPDAIRKAITERTRAVVTISPNNPTGAVYSKAALTEVNEICGQREIFHISDEAYEYFTYGSARHFSPGSIHGAGAHTISLFSLSKSFGMASWRVGYMLIPEVHFEAVNKIQDTVLICPPVVSQYAAVGAMQAGATYCRDKLVRLAETRALVLEELDSLGPACQIPNAEGAFYFLLRLDTSIEPLKLVSRLIKEFGVAAIPGTAFGSRGACELRISYGALDRDTVAEGVGRLVRGIKSILGV
jgi:aspartate/methionine/tyrosine aminotransferase